MLSTHVPQILLKVSQIHGSMSFLLCSKWTVFNHSLQCGPRDRGLSSESILMSASPFPSLPKETNLPPSAGQTWSRVSAGNRMPQSTCNSGLISWQPLLPPQNQGRGWTTEGLGPFSWPLLSRGLLVWSSCSSLDSHCLVHISKEFYIPLQSPWTRPRNLAHPFSS